MNLPHGIRAECHWPKRLILMDRRLLQAERRSALAHELEHVRRGPYPRHAHAREEAAINATASRKLIDIHELGEALAWAHNLPEAAEELWVDLPTLQARLEHLHPSERHYLRRRLAHHHHDEPEGDTHAAAVEH